MYVTCTCFYKLVKAIITLTCVCLFYVCACIVAEEVGRKLASHAERSISAQFLLSRCYFSAE